MKFNTEKEFQIWLGRELVKLGFQVYTDKKICELPVFSGDKEKPDLLVFFRRQFKENKQIEIESPFAIETKLISQSNKFSNLSHSVLQIKKYYGKMYVTDKDYPIAIANTILCTNESIFTKNVFNWSCGSEEFNKGINWALVRILFSLSNKSGILKFDGEHFYIEYHNSNFYLLQGGSLGYKPSQWNNNETGY